MATPTLLSQTELGTLLQVLVQRGYTVLGPRLRDGAIVFDEVAALDELPRGLTDAQAPGHYRVESNERGLLFDYCSTGQSLKTFFHPPVQTLFTIRKSATGPSLITPTVNAPRVAVLAARGCDLAALRTLDGVLDPQSDREAGTANTNPHADLGYRARRAQVFTVAVHCTNASATCFCASMGTGPRVNEAFDLALTELPLDGRSEFVVEVGSELGRQVLDAARPPTTARRATAAEVEQAESLVEQTRASMRALPEPAGLRQALQDNLEHPRWQAVAERCLACANCTMVCPTCFCTTVEERQSLAPEPMAPDASGQAAYFETSRDQSWDSCFTGDYSQLHGSSVRGSTSSRYRQWLTHKFSTWWDQFAGPGCVGCGRCVTWCPVGIDVVEELTAIRADQPLVETPS